MLWISLLQSLLQVCLLIGVTNAAYLTPTIVYCVKFIQGADPVRPRPRYRDARDCSRRPRLRGGTAAHVRPRMLLEEAPQDIHQTADLRASAPGRCEAGAEEAALGVGKR